MLTTNGTKYVFVCDPDECDTLIEVTCVSGFDFPNGVIKHTCPCGRQMTYISATILTSEQPTKEETMIANALPEETESVSELRGQITSLEYVSKTLKESVNNYYAKEQRLRSYLVDNAEDMEHHASEIAEIFDIPLTREVEFEATVIVRGTLEVEIFGGIDIEDYISENLTVDSFNGDVSIFDYSVDSVSQN
jgi:hypothetical protein